MVKRVLGLTFHGRLTVRRRQRGTPFARASEAASSTAADGCSHRLQRATSTQKHLTDDGGVLHEEVQFSVWERASRRAAISPCKVSPRWVETAPCRPPPLFAPLGHQAGVLLGVEGIAFGQGDELLPPPPGGAGALALQQTRSTSKVSLLGGKRSEQGRTPRCACPPPHAGLRSSSSGARGADPRESGTSTARSDKVVDEVEQSRRRPSADPPGRAPAAQRSARPSTNKAPGGIGLALDAVSGHPRPRPSPKQGPQLAGNPARSPGSARPSRGGALELLHGGFGAVALEDPSLLPSRPRRVPRK